MKEFKFLGTSKPSDALKALLEGIRKVKRRKSFKVEMNTFLTIRKPDGNNNNKICLGCCATLTLEELSGKRFIHLNEEGLTRNYKRQEYLANNIKFEDENKKEAFEIYFHDFEMAIDIYREWGSISRLLVFYRIYMEDDYDEKTSKFYEGRSPLEITNENYNSKETRNYILNDIERLEALGW